MIETNERYSVAESAQIAIEAGAQWLVLRADTIDESERRDIGKQVADLCRESGVILTVDSDIEFARELGIHGVLLRPGSKAPAAVREELGPEAIIGVEISSADTALALERNDIDYVALSADMQLDRVAELIAAVRKAEGKIAFVSLGEQPTLDGEYIDGLKAAGIAGLCCGKALFAAPDPVVAIENLMSELMA